MIGLILRFWCIKINPGHLMVTVAPEKICVIGPYNWVRHPSYSAMFLMFFEFSFWLGISWKLIVLMFWFLLIGLNYIARMEELTILQSPLGKEYEEYMKKVKGRFIPWPLNK